MTEQGTGQSAEIARTVFVSGGTSGINLGIARDFAARGNRVAVLSRSQEKVDAAVQELTRLSEAAGGHPALGFAADVREAADVATAVDSVAQAWGQIDVVISGAAGNFPVPAAELSPGGFKAVVGIDLLGTFNVMHAVYPHLRKPGASIINISAGQAWLPVPKQVHVNAAKAGVDQVTRTLAAEWGPEGVRVNSVAPGPIAGTEGMRRLSSTQESESAITRQVPLGRYGTTDDIAQAVRWLTSEQASYVTGAVIPVDGGLALRGAAGMSFG